MISQRAAFELEYSKRYPIAAAAPGKFNIDPYGEYEDTTVNVAWFMWQSACALAQPRAKVSDAEIHMLHDVASYLDMDSSITASHLAGSVRAVLDAQGDAPAQADPVAHTLEQDFQHFLTVKGWSNAHPTTVAMLREAYAAAWEPTTVPADILGVSKTRSKNER